MPAAADEPGGINPGSAHPGVEPSDRRPAGVNPSGAHPGGASPGGVEQGDGIPGGAHDAAAPQPTPPARLGGLQELCLPLLERCSFATAGTAGTSVNCGLSGGPDSAALVALATAAGFEVTAWHVNHGLRPDAHRDETAARTIAHMLGTRFEVVTLHVVPGPDLEARARRARYDALPEDVLVGHTADDRAETVLFNIARGSGLAGAASPHRRVGRPLLGLRRAETRELCERLALPVAHDPMNDDESFARVAIRKRVMPELARALRRDPVPLLNRHADLAAEAHDAITAAATDVDPSDAAALVALPRAVATEALRGWISEHTGKPPGAVSAASINRVMQVAAGECVATEITGGHRVARTQRRLRIELPDPAASRAPTD